MCPALFSEDSYSAWQHTQLRSGQEVRVAALNELLQARLKSDEATYIDMTSELVQPDGRIIRDLFTDGLHPNKEGYQRMAKMLEKAMME